MVEGPGSTPPTEERVSTGSPELDTILHGGLVPHRPYLIVGPSGTGKTTLALQFLCEGVRRGERVLLITLEEPPNEMRINHRGLLPEFDQVYVFDAIPDVMRYERTPFKDIAAVRESVPFDRVSLQIRKTPELSSVEVTFTALEQTIKMEVGRRAYSRIAVDSLTALQYFCMKGVDEIVGAQTFLRFLSDLRVTTILTVESPLEDIETPERLLARGEIRLFRWELDGRTVRALGVEKFRGSSHDVRLHPYRITSQGLAVNLGVTISRDTRRVIEEAAVREAPGAVPEGTPIPGRDPIREMEEEIGDLAELGVPLADVRHALAETVAALEHERPDEAVRCFRRARQLVLEAAERTGDLAPPGGGVGTDDARGRAVARLTARAVEARTGTVPVGERELMAAGGRLLAMIGRLSLEQTTAAPIRPDAPPTVGPPPRSSVVAPVPPPPPPPATVPLAPLPPPPAPPPPPPVLPAVTPSSAARPREPRPAASTTSPALAGPLPRAPKVVVAARAQATVEPAAPAPPPPAAPETRPAAPEPPPLPTATRDAPALLVEATGTSDAKTPLPPVRAGRSVATPAAAVLRASARDPERPSLPKLPEIVPAPAGPSPGGTDAGMPEPEEKGVTAKRRRRATVGTKRKVTPPGPPPTEVAPAVLSGESTEPKARRRAPRKKKPAAEEPGTATPAEVARPESSAAVPANDPPAAVPMGQADPKGTA